MSTRHYTIVARSWNRMHIFFLFYYSNDFVVVLFLCGRLLMNIFLNMLATLNDRDDSQYHNFNGCAQGNSETVHT